MGEPRWESERPSWWSHWVICAVTEEVSAAEAQECLQADAAYFRLRGSTPARFVRMRTVPSPGPLEEFLRPYLGEAIAACTESRQFWSRLPLELPTLTYHAYTILEAAGGQLFVLCERKGQKLEVMFGIGPGPLLFMREMRTNGCGRNMPRCLTQPRQEVDSGVTVQDFLDWLDGPLARRWRPYSLWSANCQHLAQELQQFLLDPFAELDIPARDKSTRRGVLAEIRTDPRALQAAPEEFRQDRKFVLAAVAQNWQALLFAPEAFRRDKRIALAAVGQHDVAFFALQNVAGELREDREVVLAAVRKDGSALQYAAEAVRKDRSIVLAAVRQNGRALRHASAELRGDVEVALAAAWQDLRALQYLKL